MVVLELKEAFFKSEIEDFQGTALVDFWATWCGPCQIMGPIVEEFAKDYEGKVKVAKVNVDDNQSLASRFSIMSIPTLIFFRDGKMAEQMVGVQSRETLKEKADQLLSQK